MLSKFKEAKAHWIEWAKKKKLERWIKWAGPARRPYEKWQRRKSGIEDEQEREKKGKRKAILVKRFL